MDFTGGNCDKLPKEIQDRIDSYHKMAKDDNSYNKVTSMEYSWKSFFTDLDRYDITKEEEQLACFRKKESYNEIIKENPNILKVNGLNNLLKKLLKKVKARDNRKIRERK